MVRLLATFLVAAGSAAIAASAPVAPQAVTLDRQLQQARSEASAAVAEQKRLERIASKATDELTRLRARQLAAAQAIAATEARISAADSRARIAAARLEVQRRQLAVEQAPLSALLAGLVLTSRRPPVLLLADSGSAQELIKLRILVDSTAPAIRARTQALSSDLERARRLKFAANAARDDIRKQRLELEGRRTALAALESRASELATRRGIEALGAGDAALSSSERLSGIEGEAESARSSAALASELARLGPAPLRRAETATPPPLAYRLPAGSRVTEGLGAVSANGIRSRGVTLATRRGQALVVPAGGIILFAGPFRDYDGVIIIDHGSGWKSVLVNAGTRLPKGERIEIGDPLGLALGPVEVQLHRSGEAVSPALIAGSSAMLSNGSKGG